jgi:hypothetical protein
VGRLWMWGLKRFTSGETAEGERGGSGVLGLGLFLPAVSFFSFSKLWIVFGSRASRSSAALLRLRPLLPEGEELKVVEVEVEVEVEGSRSADLLLFVSRLRSRVQLRVR